MVYDAYVVDISLGEASDVTERNLNKTKNLWRWQINTIIDFLDIIHRPVFLN
jgi:hypothetical protein